MRKICLSAAALLLAGLLLAGCGSASGPAGVDGASQSAEAAAVEGGEFAAGREVPLPVILNGSRLELPGMGVSIEPPEGWENVITAENLIVEEGVRQFQDPVRCLRATFQSGGRVFRVGMLSKEAFRQAGGESLLQDTLERPAAFAGLYREDVLYWLEGDSAFRHGAVTCTVPQIETVISHGLHEGTIHLERLDGSRIAVPRYDWVIVEDEALQEGRTVEMRYTGDPDQGDGAFGVIGVFSERVTCEALPIP